MGQKFKQRKPSVWGYNYRTPQNQIHQNTGFNLLRYSNGKKSSDCSESDSIRITVQYSDDCKLTIWIPDWHSRSDLNTKQSANLHNLTIWELTSPVRYLDLHGPRHNFREIYLIYVIYKPCNHQACLGFKW